MPIKGELQLPKMVGIEINPGIILMAEPTPISGSNLFRCLANVHGALAIVELKLIFDTAQRGMMRTVSNQRTIAHE